ncbi:GNAT family N-acetyltransferase [Streptomyces sp. NPDC050147]|uniref:GNAT family N-acetyltransferase n=1 Tax=Streptomyces sp. NPDC050147 TaxID=3155513 RepID=UPI00342BA57E
MIDALPDGLTARHLAEEDHPQVLAVLDSWWGGMKGPAGALERSLLLPRLYFQHFTTTSFVVERDEEERQGNGQRRGQDAGQPESLSGGGAGGGGRVAAFLVGFLSQSETDAAYVHFVGVDPQLHGHGIGRSLYRAFFALARSHGRRYVHCVTSPQNTASQAFHARLGFTVSTVKPDYDGPGLDRVTFTFDLAANRGLPEGAE